MLSIPPPSVTLSTSEGKISVHRDYSSKQLDRMQGGNTTVNLRAGWETSGLTKSKLVSRIKINVTYRKIGKKRICIGLASVSVQVGYPHFNIYVARKLKHGSCAYKTTMAHEQKHVSIYRDQLQIFLPIFEQQLNQTAKKLMPIVYKSSKAGNKYFLRKLNTEFKRVLKQMNNETKRLHGRLDTPKSYRKEQELCPTS